MYTIAVIQSRILYRFCTKRCTIRSYRITSKTQSGRIISGSCQSEVIFSKWEVCGGSLFVVPRSVILADLTVSVLLLATSTPFDQEQLLLPGDLGMDQVLLRDLLLGDVLRDLALVIFTFDTDLARLRL